MSFRVLVYCRDCNGQDPLGCFDGNSEFLYSDSPPYEIEKFATLGEAITAGVEETKGSIWEFEVQALDGKKVEFE